MISTIFKVLKVIIGKGGGGGGNWWWRWI